MFLGLWALDTTLPLPHILLFKAILGVILPRESDSAKTTHFIHQEINTQTKSPKVRQQACLVYLTSCKQDTVNYMHALVCILFCFLENEHCAQTLSSHQSNAAEEHNKTEICTIVLNT